MSKDADRRFPDDAGPPTDGISRRDFLKLTGTTLPAGTLLAQEVFAAAAPAAGPVVGPEAVPVTLNINGRARSVEVEPRQTLLDALRDVVGLTGAKRVCDRGTCGACTVLVDGMAVYACSMLAIEAQGRQITTIEGLAPERELHAVSAAFVTHDAQQCGFCTPGFVVATKAFLDRHPNATEEEVTQGLGGNLCRCGTYVGVRKAAVEAARRLKGGPA
ncbi:MAG: 2Fe-2S iron-sulfur cluster binding domain-containing protein [Gemmatimonadetes bacterium]|nr:2Fe-2S iron-sulfur cluster binding domain-containing protein [Gemmatimonadota bacterium]